MVLNSSGKRVKSKRVCSLSDEAQYSIIVRLVKTTRRRVGEEGCCIGGVVVLVEEGSHEVSKNLNTHYLANSQQFRGN